MNLPLKDFVGTLTASQVLDGISACQANANRLVADAETLASVGSFASAAALAILAIEELGKVTLLRRLALVSDPKELRAVWSDFRNHRAKNAGWVIPDLVRQGGRSLLEFGAALDRKSDHSAQLNAVKQMNIYTDCIGEDGDWLSPSDEVARELAAAMIDRAHNTWGRKEVTLRDIELWMELLTPHYGKPTMREAYLTYQRAMNAEGLSKMPEQDMRAFLYGETGWPPPDQDTVV